MKIVSKVLQCEIFYFIFAWFLWLIIYLLLNIFFWINQINKTIDDIVFEMKNPIECEFNYNNK